MIFFLSLALAQDTTLLQELEKERACIRGLSLDPLPTQSRQSTEEFMGFLQEELKTEYSEPKGIALTHTLKGLGFIPLELNLESSLMNMMKDQAAAYYNPATKGFYLVQELSPIESKATIVHELQHAAQDQHTPLIQSYSRSSYSSLDEELAVRFLVEGEATLVQMSWMLDFGIPFLKLLSLDECSVYPLSDKLRLHWEVKEDYFRDIGTMSKEELLYTPKWLSPFMDMMGFSTAPTKQLKELPPFLYYTLVSPYLKGAWFSYQVLQSNNWDFKALDAYFLEPPTTTQLILHPTQKSAQSFIIPKKPSFLNKKYLSEAVSPNRMGEFMLAVWLITLELNEETAFSIASGWNGDRVQVFQKEDDSYAVSWVILWADLQTHHQFRTTISALLPSFLGIEKDLPLEAPAGNHSFESPQGKGNITWKDQEIHLQWGW